jgi:DNA-binding HxlR family transcriptional regulator
MQTINESYAAQVSRIVELFQGKWTIQILCAMREHPVRLSELKREIPYASRKALTASLRALEAARLVIRRDLSSSVLHVEYELAEPMREPLVMLLDHLAKWANFYESEDRSKLVIRSKVEQS